VGTKNLRVVEYDINDILHRTRTRHIPGHGFESLGKTRTGEDVGLEPGVIARKASYLPLCCLSMNNV